MSRKRDKIERLLRKAKKTWIYIGNRLRENGRDNGEEPR